MKVLGVIMVVAILGVIIGGVVVAVRTIALIVEEMYGRFEH